MGVFGYAFASPFANRSSHRPDAHVEELQVNNQALAGDIQDSSPGRSSANIRMDRYQGRHEEPLDSFVGCSVRALADLRINRVVFPATCATADNILRHRRFVI